MDDPLPKAEIFSPKTAFFAQKAQFLGQFLMDFFIMERGGTPLHPLTDTVGQSVADKLAENS